MSFLGEVKATIVSRNIDCHRVKQCPRSFFCVMRESVLRLVVVSIMRSQQLRALAYSQSLI